MLHLNFKLTTGWPTSIPKPAFTWHQTAAYVSLPIITTLPALLLIAKMSETGVAGSQVYLFQVGGHIMLC